jgi:hypothetical protein
VTSDDLGAFNFVGISARDYVVRAKLDDLYSGPVDVTVSETASEPLTIRVKRQGTLIVHVTGDGAPIAGAEVTLGWNPDPDHLWTVATDATGTATHRGVRPWTTALVRAPGWCTEVISSGAKDDPTGVSERFVALRRGAPVEGVVLGPDDKPVAAAQVSLSSLANVSGWVGETVTDAQGAWRVEMPIGTYTAYATSDALARSPRTTIRIATLEPQADIVLCMTKGGQIRGRVVDEHGAPVADANVVANVPNEDRRQGRSGTDGTFDLRGLRPQTYVVRARKFNVSASAKDRAAGRTRVTNSNPSTPSDRLVHRAR